MTLRGVWLSHAAAVSLRPPLAVRPLFLTACRCASTSSSSTAQPRPAKIGKNGRRAKNHGTNTPAKSKSSVGRELNADLRKFITPEGRLRTTPANVRFFADNPSVDHDHGKMVHLRTLAPDIKDITKTYHVQLAYSPLHIIHPHHLPYFIPRGHPGAPKLRADYAKKTRDEPLWAFTTGYGDAAVVRNLTRRRLLGSVFRRLEQMGYKDGRHSDGSEIRGTLWIKALQPTAVVGLSLDRFGDAVAEVLHKHCARKPDEMQDAGDGMRREAPTKRTNSDESRRIPSRPNNADRRGPVRDAVWDTLNKNRRGN